MAIEIEAPVHCCFDWLFKDSIFAEHAHVEAGSACFKDSGISVTVLHRGALQILASIGSCGE